LLSNQKRMYMCHVGFPCIDITIVVVGVIIVAGRGGARILTQGGANLKIWKYVMYNVS